MPTWYEDTRTTFAADTPTTVEITVTGRDHPSALLIAANAGRAVATAQHLDELSDIPTGELYYLLNDVRKLATAAAVIEEALILRYRASGASWADLGAALDTGRAAARERHNRIQAAHTLGLNLRGAEDHDAERHAREGDR